MPADHLKELIQRCAPGHSVRALERSAGVTPGKLSYWLKPSTAHTRMPTMDQLLEWARIIGCTADEVYAAVKSDVDGDTGVLTGELAADERELLALYRRLPPSDRERLRRIADVLHSG